MKLTKHASQRFQQRGFRRESLDLIFQYGEQHFRNGVNEYFMSDKATNLAIAEHPEKKHEFERLRGKAILERWNKILTLINKYKKRLR